MQISIDGPGVLDAIAQAGQWFGDNPWRLVFPYLAATFAIGVKIARGFVRQAYDHIRAGERKLDGTPRYDSTDAVVPALMATLIAPVWVPIYAAWRVFRAGLGPIPSGTDDKKA